MRLLAHQAKSSPGLLTVFPQAPVSRKHHRMLDDGNHKTRSFSASLKAIAISAASLPLMLGLAMFFRLRFCPVTKKQNR